MQLGRQLQMDQSPATSGVASISFEPEGHPQTWQVMLGQGAEHGKAEARCVLLAERRERLRDESGSQLGLTIKLLR